MGKDQELLSAVRDQNFSAVNKIISKYKIKSKKTGNKSAKKWNLNFQESKDGMSSLHQAALAGNTEIMRLLLDGGAAVDIKDKKGMRPLHYAVWQGHIDPVRLLMQYGSQPNEPSTNGIVPLHLACQHGHFDIVKVLLHYHSLPTVVDGQMKNPFDVACEFGQYRIVEFLLRQESLNERRFLQPLSSHMVDGYSTCLHLAARGGHANVLRLLLEYGADKNWCTKNGTALHEAVMYGRKDLIILLLDFGIDVNIRNCHNQLAVDIAHKIAASNNSIGAEMFQLLSYCNCAYRAQAITDYSPAHDEHGLHFQRGDMITVVQCRSDGMWSGYHARGARPSNQLPPLRIGFFPSTAVQILTNPSSHYQQRISSPVPSGPTNQTGDMHLPPSTPLVVDAPPQDAYVSTAADSPDSGFPPPPSPLAVDAAVLDGANRNSNDSLDSGRGGSYQSADTRSNSSAHQSGVSTVASHQHHRLSGQSYESGVSSGSRQSYHSNSTSSSLEHIDGASTCSDSTASGGSAAGMTVHFRNGTSVLYQSEKDREIMAQWITDLGLPSECFTVLVNAGYDLPTLSRSTPEDLTAAGITKPDYRKVLKGALAHLNLRGVDSIPDYQPSTLAEWLRCLQLSEYMDLFTEQGYTIDNVNNLTWEDLADIGISKLGHQKKLILAIEKIRRAQKAGAPIPQISNVHPHPQSSQKAALSPNQQQQQQSQQSSHVVQSVNSSTFSAMPNSSFNSGLSPIPRRPNQFSEVHQRCFNQSIGSVPSTPNAKHVPLVLANGVLPSGGLNSPKDSALRDSRHSSGGSPRHQPIVPASFGSPQHRLAAHYNGTPLSQSPAMTRTNSSPNPPHPLVMSRQQSEPARVNGLVDGSSDSGVFAEALVKPSQHKAQSPRHQLALASKLKKPKPPVPPKRSQLSALTFNGQHQQFVPALPNCNGNTNCSDDTTDGSTYSREPDVWELLQQELDTNCVIPTSSNHNQHNGGLLLTGQFDSKHCIAGDYATLKRPRHKKPLPPSTSDLTSMDLLATCNASPCVPDMPNSPGVLQSCSSSSSIDSNTLPFANENVGTIKSKQRSGANGTCTGSSVLTPASGVDYDEPPNSPEANFLQHDGASTLVRRPIVDQPAGQPTSCGGFCDDGMGTIKRGTAQRQSSPPKDHHAAISSPVTRRFTPATTQQLAKPADRPAVPKRADLSSAVTDNNSRPPRSDSDVLDDIGDMLHNLSAELDAMLIAPSD